MALIAIIPLLAGAPEGSLLLPNSRTNTSLFVLEGYSGSAWTEIPSDEYRVGSHSGKIQSRSQNDSDVDVSWAFDAYQCHGTLLTPGGLYEFVDQPLAFSEVTPDKVIDTDESANLELAYNALIQELIVQDGLLRADEHGIQTDNVQVSDILRLGGGKQGPRKARTIVNDDTFGEEAWTDPESAKRRDALFATASVDGVVRTTTQYLRATNFGFRIPHSATILGYELQVTGYASSGSGHYIDAYLYKNGIRGTSQGSSFGATEDMQTIGDRTNLWDASLSAEDVNASDFGIVFWGTSDPLIPIDFFVNFIRLAVYYRTATGSTVVEMHGNHIDSVGVINLDASDTPSNPASSDDGNIYLKDGKIIFHYNDAGVPGWKYLDLTGTGVTWVYSASAP